MIRKMATLIIASQLLVPQLSFAVTQDVKVEPIKGTTFKRVTLTEKVIKRLGIKIAEVRSKDDTLEVVPYSAVIYDKHGNTWLYTNPKPFEFVRQLVIVDHIDGDLAFLKQGPPAKTDVVSVGVVELSGIELGVEHEDL